MIVPSYYNEFKCIAEKCSHSCCIGWEIDIDEETLALYESDTSPFGRKIAGNISEPAHFTLSDDERCPFLNKNGLCDIIIEKGEGHLCRICREHPRFYSEWPGLTEAGLGLCCEEAARIILSQKKPFTFIPDEAVITDAYAQDIYNIRSRMLDAVFYADDPEKEVLKLVQIDDFETDIKTWAEFYIGLERLDEKWTEILQGITCRGSFPPVSYKNIEYRNLLAYFLYRHIPEAMDDDDIDSKAAFAVLSCRIIAAAHTLEYGDLYEISRIYSSEIEYSLDNLYAIYDKLWDDLQ